ncbi:MAG TPA: hypothetical protein V6C63_06050 [Allocoleopsis sp.]
MALFRYLEPIISPMLLVSLLAHGSASAPTSASTPKPAPAAIAQCTLVYRPSITLSYRPEQQAKLTIRRDRQPAKVTLGSFEFQALYNQEPDRGQSVQLIVTPIVKPGVNNLPIASQVYLLPAGQPLRNQFAKGQGFTGSNSIFNPKDFSELQYSCISSS